METSLTQERLKECLSYNAETGVFRWKRLVRRVKVGTEAKSLDSHGYIRIRIDGREYRAHRLAWLYVHGQWPVDQIDHINCERSDNRIENLRQANNSLNNFNRKTQRNNTSGSRGVRWDKAREKWRAEIKKNGKSIILGRFPENDMAMSAYRSAAVTMFGEFCYKGL